MKTEFCFEIGMKTLMRSECGIEKGIKLVIKSEFCFEEGIKTLKGERKATDCVTIEVERRCWLEIMW